MKSERPEFDGAFCNVDPRSPHEKRFSSVFCFLYERKTRSSFVSVQRVSRSSSSVLCARSTLTSLCAGRIFSQPVRVDRFFTWKQSPEERRSFSPFSKWLNVPRKTNPVESAAKWEISWHQFFSSFVNHVDRFILSDDSSFTLSNEIFFGDDFVSTVFVDSGKLSDFA